MKKNIILSFLILLVLPSFVFAGGDHESQLTDVSLRMDTGSSGFSIYPSLSSSTIYFLPKLNGDNEKYITIGLYKEETGGALGNQYSADMYFNGSEVVNNASNHGADLNGTQWRTIIVDSLDSVTVQYSGYYDRLDEWDWYDGKKFYFNSELWNADRITGPHTKTFIKDDTGPESVLLNEEDISGWLDSSSVSLEYQLTDSLVGLDDSWFVGGSEVLPAGAAVSYELISSPDDNTRNVRINLSGMPNGSHEISFQVQDRFGSRTEINRWITVDTGQTAIKIAEVPIDSIMGKDDYYELWAHADLLEYDTDKYWYSGDSLWLSINKHEPEVESSNAYSISVDQDSTTIIDKVDTCGPEDNGWFDFTVTDGCTLTVERYRHYTDVLLPPVNTGTDVYVFSNDTTPPECTLTDLLKPTDVPENIYSDTRTLDYSITDNETGIGDTWLVPESISLPEGANVSYSTMLSVGEYTRIVRFIVSDLPEGECTFSFQVQNRIGLTTAMETPLTVDTVPPEVSIVINTPGVVSGGTYNIDSVIISAESDESAFLFSYSINGGEEIDCGREGITEKEIVFEEQGSYSIVVYARDIAGNVGESEPVILNIITAIPEITANILTPGVVAGGAYNLPSVTLNATANAPGLPITNYYFSINSEEMDSWNGTDDIVIEEEGAYSIIFYAVDEAGGTGQSEPVTFILDRTAPVINFFIDSPVGLIPGEWTNNDVSYSYTVADTNGSGVDNSSILYSYNGGDSWITEYTDHFETQGTHLFSVHVEDLAGNAAENTLYVRIDREGPSIVAECYPFCSVAEDYIAVSTLSAEDPDAGMVTSPEWEYSIDGTEYIQFSAEQGFMPIVEGKNPQLYDPAVAWINDSRFSDGTLAEGVHRLDIRTTDSVGNYGYASSIEFIIDNTVPVISAVQILDGSGNPVEENSYLTSNSADVSLTMADTYLNEGEESAGEIRGFFTLFSNDPIADPDLSSAEYYQGNETSGSILSGFENGANYVYSWPLDKAYNIGEVFERVVLFDSSTPLAPVVTSTTHLKAVQTTDALPFSDAVFNIAPQGSTASGISHYVWQLYKGTDIIKEGSLESDGLKTVSFEDLDDNDLDEFYLLEVRTVSGNGYTSNPGSFQFRIDSSPPEELSLYVSPHIDPSAWYRQKTAVLTWSTPIDMTGIKRYCYLISSDEISLPLTDEEKLLFDISGWGETTEETVSVNLVEQLSSDAGHAYIYLCAEDYVGNREFSSYQANYDTVAPSLGEYSADEYLQADCDLEERTAVIRHNPASDNLTDFDPLLEPAVSIRLSEIAEDGVPFIVREYQESSGNQAAFDGLKDDCAYLAEANVRDAAGNTAIFRYALRLDGQEVTNIAMPFEYEYEGYFVSGTRSLAYAEAKLAVSDLLGMKEIVDGEEVDGPFTFDQVIFNTDTGEFEQGNFNNSRVFVMSVHGLAVSATGVSFYAETGLLCSQAELAINKYDEQSEEITEQIAALGDFSVGFAPRFDMETASPAVYADGEFSYRTLDGENNQAFILSSVNETGLSEDSLAIKGTEWNTVPLFETYNIDIYTLAAAQGGGTEKVRKVSVDTAFVDNNERLKNGTIGLPMNLEAGGALLEITAGWLAVDELVVADSRIILPEGFEPREPAIRNFAVNVNGEIVKKGGYYADGFSWTDGNGNVYSFDSIDIVNGAFYAVNGTLTISATSTSYVIEGMRLGIDGPIFDDPISVSQKLNFELSGYMIESEDAVIDQDGFLLKSATVKELPATFGGGDRTLSDLGVSLSGDSVTRTGISTDSFTITPPSFNGEVGITGMEFSEDGLYAAEGWVAVPDSFVAGTEQLDFANLKLNSDGTFGTAAISDSFSLAVDGFSLNAEGGTFDGSAIALGNTVLQMPSTVSPTEVSMNGLSLGGEGLINSGVSEEELRYGLDGWIFLLEGLELSNEGLYSTASIAMPRSLGGRKASFPSFRLLSDGSCETGPAADGAFVRIGGWLTELEGISLDGEVLRAATGTVTTYASMGGAEFVFTDIVLDSTGKFVSSGTGTESKTFTSENGYQVDASTYTLSDDGISITGDVHFPIALGENAIATYDEQSPVMLYYTGIIETKASSQQVNCSFAGWDIIAQSYYFDERGLTISSSSLLMSIFGINSIPLPELSFYSDGTVKAAGKSFENFGLDIFGGRFELDKFTFGDDGLSTAAYIKLPPQLGEFEIYFDDLTLHPDGKITTETIIPEFTFYLKKADIDFVFRNIRFDEDGFSIGEGIITLPEAMEHKQVRITNFSIDSNGNFNLGGVGFDPFEMWGFTFFIDSIGLSNTELTFDGGIQLPSGLPVGLSNRYLAIADFKYSIENNEVESFDVSLQGEFVFDLTDEISFSVDTFGVRKEEESGDILMYVDKGSLELPASLGLGKIEIFDVSINPKTLAFNFDNVTISGFSWEVYGIQFVLDSLKFNSDFDMTFAGSVTLPSGESVPEFIRGQSITVETFEIDHNGVIGDVKGSYSFGEEEKKLFDIIAIKNARIDFDKTDEDLVLGFGGELSLTGSSIPEGLADKPLNLTTLQINTTTWEIEAFDASISNLSFDLFNTVRFENTSIAAGLTDDGDFELGFIGDIFLPEAFPEYLRADPLHITNFVIDSTGHISEFGLVKNFSGEAPLVGGITVSNTRFEAFKDPNDDRILFKIDGTTFTLGGESFPEGIKDATATLEEFHFDSLGNIDSVVADLTLTDGNLFGKIPMTGAGISLDKNGNSDLYLGFHGTFGMPEGTPEGLEDVTIGVNNLVFSSSGKVEDIDVKVSNINANILGLLNLSGGEIAIAPDGNEGLLFTVKGDVSLPENLPEPLNTTTFALDIAVSTTRGLDYFSAGIVSTIEFDLYAGMKARFNSLEISSDGFSMSGSLVTPSSLPVIGQRTISFNNFAMDWDGNITDFEVTLEEKIEGTLIGFTVEIENITIGKEYISIGSAIMTLPPALKSVKVGMKNASISWDGEFSAEFVAPDLKFDIAGFNLLLEGPNLDIEGKKISFTKTSLKMPALVGGGTLTLNNMSIGPDGLNFGGGGFELPSFKIGDNIEFSLKVDFAIDGKEYYIAGGGKIVVPGMGGFEVEASFTNKSDIYPWGLKRAYFAWEAAGMGIPLGTTGLYMNGIRGGLAFGPPDELPACVQRYFPNGTRIQAGFSIAAASSKIMQGKVDAWIDITNGYFAMDGSVSVLNGFFTSEMTAAITSNLFYGRVAFSLKFVRGQAELWIYKSGKKVKIAGQGEVQFGLRKGCIVNKKVWFVRIRIPSRNIWLAKIGARFGDFTNGKSGFYGYCKLPIIGNVGLFAGSGTFKFGKLKGYNLSIPGGPAYSAAPGLAKSSGPAEEIARGDDSREITRVVYLDSESGRKFAQDKYIFTVPENKVKSVIKQDQMPEMAKYGWNSEMGPDAATETVEVNAVERIIFIIGYEEGAPVITAQSTSGTLFGVDYGNAEEFQEENGSALVIMDPEPGQWELNIDGLAPDQKYVIEVMGKNRSPEISEVTPQYQGMSAAESFTVTGTAQWYSGTNATLRVNLVSDADEQSIGFNVAETELTEQGQFSVELDTLMAADGTYKVVFEVDDGDSVPFIIEAEGTLEIKNTLPIPAVTDLVVNRNDDKSIMVNFEPSSNVRTAGYNLYVRDGGETIYRNIGCISQCLIPGMAEGQTYDIWITPYDSEKTEGMASAILSYTHEDTAAEINIPELLGPEGGALPGQLDLDIGSFVELPIGSSTDSFVQTGDAYEYASIEVLEAPAWITVLTDQPQYRLDGCEGIISISTCEFITEAGDLLSPAPGQYTLRIKLKNLGNPELADEFETQINVIYPAPAISDVYPSEWHCLDRQDITVIGEHFLPGTRFFVNDLELEVRRLENHEAEFTVPAVLEGGENIIRAVGPGGQQGEFSIDIVEPEYLVQVCKTVGRETPGSSEHLYFSVVGYNRFDSEVNVNDLALPEGWTADPVAPVSTGEVGEIVIHIPENYGFGEYAVVAATEDGHTMNFIVEVLSVDPAPEMRLIHPSAVIAGHEFSVFGNSLGDIAGTVLLDENELAVISWSDDRIIVQTTHDSITGMLSVLTADGTLVGEQQLTIKDTGFAIYPEQERLELQPGDNARIQVALKGAALPVDLEAYINDSQGNKLFNADLENPVITPNGITFLNINIGQDAVNGTYTLTIHGTSESFESYKSLDLIIGDAFTVITDALPAAMVNMEYYAEIKTENASGKATFSIDEGSMPLGLWIKSNGIISGKPSETGESEFSIKAVDEEGHTAVCTYTIAVTENVWSMDGKDEGRSRYIPTPGPAYGTLSWQNEWTESESSENQGMIAGDGRVFAWSGSGLRAYEQPNGHLMWSEENQAEKAVYLGGKLYVLYSEGNLVCHDARYGNVIWNRENVEMFTTGKGIVYLWQQSANGHDLILITTSDGDNVPEGYVIAIYENTELPNGETFWYKGSLLSYSGTTVERLSESDEGAAWETVLTADATVESACTLDDTLVMLINDGMLYRYSAQEDDSLTLVNEIQTGMNTGTAVCSNRLFGAYGENGIALYSTETGSLSVSRMVPVREALLSKDKLYIADANSIQSVNIYDGTTIWSEIQPDKERRNAIVSNGRLFTLGGDSAGSWRIEAWTGEPNRDAPEVHIVFDPAVPDGLNDYYISEGTVSLQIRDRESYAAEKKWRIDSGVYSDYTGPVAIEEGIHSIVANATDSEGKYSMDVIAGYQADLNDPVTTITIETEPITGTDEEWYGEQPVFSLAAEDTYSGIDFSEYRLNNGEWQTYSVPVTILTEGRNLLEFRSHDRAGRVEETQSVELLVDRNIPEAEHHAVLEPGLGIVYLSATDEGSGVKHIMYALDEVHRRGIIEGEWKAYDMPLVITDPGMYRLRYYAVDNAGQEGDREMGFVRIEAYTQRNLFADISYGRIVHGRWIIEGIKAGDRIFANGMGRHNRFASVPEGLESGFYLQPFTNDVARSGRPETFATFTAAVDIDVWMMIDPDSSQDLTGWTLSEEAHPVANAYYKNGADVYTRSYQKGETVVLQMAQGRRVLPSMYVVVPVNARGIHITEPNGILAPGSEIRISGTVLSGSAKETTVGITVGDGEEEILPVSLTDTTVTSFYDLPAAEEMEAAGVDKIAVKVHLFNAEADKTKVLTIINMRGIHIESPAPGTIVKAGTVIKPEFRLIRPDGSEEKAAEETAKVVWEQTADPTEEDPWSPAQLIDGHIVVPAAAGPWYLKASYKNREKVIRINVMETPEAQKISFGSEDEGSYTLGEQLDLGEGKRYTTKEGIECGFSGDHRGNTVSFTAVQLYWPHNFAHWKGRAKPLPRNRLDDFRRGRGPDLWFNRYDKDYLRKSCDQPEQPLNPAIEEKTAIVFNDDSEFKVRVNNGRYKIVLKTGPSRVIFGRPRITINGKTFSVMPRVMHHTQMMLICEVEVTDGWLSISGDDYPSLANISWETLDDEDPKIMTWIFPIPGLIATQIKWPPGLDPANRHSNGYYGRGGHR